jgi:hypothetical protein
MTPANTDAPAHRHRFRFCMVRPASCIIELADIPAAGYLTGNDGNGDRFMICPRCGADNPATASFCSLCMARFAPAVPPTSQPVQQAPPGPPAEPPADYDPYTAVSSYVYEKESLGARRKKNPLRAARSGVGRVVVAIVLIAFLAACGYGVYMLYMHMEKKGITGTYVDKANPSYYITCNNDGTCVVVQSVGTVTGKCEVNGDKFTFVPDDTKQWSGGEYTVRGDTLYDDQGQPWVKQK